MLQLDFRYKNDAHYYIAVPSFCSTTHYSNDKIDFVFDTGAYLTVITKVTALVFGYNRITPIQKNIPLNGFAGSATGDLKEIPGLVIGGRLLKGVKVAIPHIDTKDNILGLNVIEHFNYLIDSSKGKIYFAENLDYKIPQELKCVFINLLTPGFDRGTRKISCGTQAESKDDFQESSCFQ